MKLENNKNIFCSVSAGYSSVMMAIKLRDWFPDHNIINVMGNTSKELETKEDRFTRAGFSRMGDAKTFSGTYSPNENSDYTSGSTTMSLASWRTQGLINRVTDSMVTLIPRDGSPMKHLRRV